MVLLPDDEPTYYLTLSSPYDQSKISIFVQGSYANNTNVRKFSDVDIAVVRETPFTPNYRVGQSGRDNDMEPSIPQKEEN